MNLYEKFSKRLKEAEENKGVQVYMNTWKNYNEYGADLEAYGIKSIADGWMTPEQALEFCKKYADDEPFINDIDNYTGLDLDINEYSNAPKTLEGLIKLNDLFENGTENCTADDIPAVFEAWSDYESKSGVDIETLNEFVDFLDNGEYYVYDNVEDDFDLGKMWVEMVGGLSGVNQPENYLNTDQMKEDWQDDVNSQYEEDDPEWYEVTDDMVQEDIDSVAGSGNSKAMEEMCDRYFDYAKLGDELYSDGSWHYVDGNRCVEIR